jgi:glycosyltransferase involved in cell wall biosynthesis
MTGSPSLPLVSVGIPVFNGERYVGEALDSVLAQDYPHLEVLVSDNASTDGTEAILRRYARIDPRIRYWRNPENVGVVKNFGRALAEARGRYFTWLAADDLLCAQYVSRTVAFLEANPDVVLCASDTHIMDLAGPGVLMPQAFPEIYPDRDPRDVRRIFFTWPQAMVCFAIYGMFRRDALEASSFAGRTYRGQPVVTHMEWPILLPVLGRGRVVALAEPLRVYRYNLQSSWLRETRRLSGLDQLLLGLRMRAFLLRSAWRLVLPNREKLDLLGRALRNFLVVNLRTVRGEAARLRAAAEERRRAILSLRAEIDRRRDLLRRQGCDEPVERWPADFRDDGGAVAPASAAGARRPRWLAPVRDAVEELATDFFRPKSPQQFAEWRRDLVDSLTLREVCEERLQEIHRLTAEAERCLERLRSLQGAGNRPPRSDAERAGSDGSRAAPVRRRAGGDRDEP